MTPSIAIVGTACRYPDAASPDQLWENVLAQRRAFRRIPAERLRLEDYWSEDRAVPDAIYSTQAAVIEGWEFDRVRFRVVGSTFRAADLTHWLALDVASRALEDAGFTDGSGLPRDTTGAIVGNTLTGEFSRANTLRLRWPYVRRVVDAELARSDLAATDRRELIARLETAYKQPFPPVGEETLAGGLSNTIAGRICNHFDLKGGGYAVDGACAASLLAVITACQSLHAGDLDVALAGGVDLSLDPFELVGFAKAGALAHDEMRVYDTRSQGFWPGEGCGFVVLMREADARSQGRPIHAVIRGWGISSDGSGGITRPELEGQSLAIARAYRRAGFGPHTVAYFEGHGTGTVVGDAIELQALTRARREAGDAPPAAIGSIKANIGHTKAAAGIAGLLKATLVLRHRVLPPTSGCERPRAELTGEQATLRVLAEGQEWPDGEPARAGVSAMGFGGINTHIVIEGEAQHGSKPAARTHALLDAWQDAELFLFGAPNPADLVRQVEHVGSFAARVSRAELADLAAALSRELADTRMRAAIVASRPDALARSLATLATWLGDGVTARVDPTSGVFLGGGGDVPRIGLLFSGQASPVYATGGALARRFATAADVYRTSALPDPRQVTGTELAQPAIVAASRAGLAALDALGITATVAAGHSLGELTALHWAGVMDGNDLAQLARVRGRAMMETPGPPSGMVSIGAGANDVASVLEGTSAVIAGLNLPRQTVVSGASDAIDIIEARARERGWHTDRLTVSHAFHSPLMAPAATAVLAQLGRVALQPPRRPVASTITGELLDTDADVAQLLVRQLTSPVRFMDAVRAMGDLDLVIEVGPGQVLTSLATRLVSCPVLALDAGGRSYAGVLAVAGAAFALGARVDPAALFAERFTRRFDRDWKPSFLANPCEQAAIPDGYEMAGEIATAASAPPVPSGVTVATAGTDVLALVRRLVAERTELPVDAVLPDSRLLDDLHLNSIAVGQLVVAAARTLGLPPTAAPTDYADATVAEVSRALEERLRTGAEEPAPERIPEGVDAWIRTFTVEPVARPRTPSGTPSEPGAWRVLASADHPLRALLERRFESVGGRGIVVCLPEEPDLDAAALLLEGAHAALASRPRARFVVVQRHGGGGGFARSFHLESSEGSTCVVDVPFGDERAAEWVAAEATTTEGFCEARYDETGARTEPALRLLPVEHGVTGNGAVPAGPALLDANDVVLVTGGGKGIAAECALALARESGCRLALLGRSDPATDAELAGNLERVRAAGCRYQYVVADVTDLAAVRSAVERVEAELGPVTVVIHGAGANAPQLVRSLTREAVEHTVAAKVRGAENVLKAVTPDRLKQFLAFGSIIARTGLRGEADYALANEWLARFVASQARLAPSCRFLTIEWSVWSGVGMGQRLGRLDSLASQGVTAIHPDEGVAIFRRLVGTRLPVTSVVVTGRFGALPTLTVEPAELPLMRFLERPRVHFPGVELVVDADLSPHADPYLEDHVFGGTRLFPAVMGLEAMAQVTMALTGTRRPPAFADVRFDRPIAIGDDGTTVRVAALVRAPGVVEVALRCADTGFEVDHFRATCLTGEVASTIPPDRSPASRVDTPPIGATSVDASPAPSIDPRRDLYGGILFHRGRFRRIAGYRSLRATACTADISPDGGVAWFGRYLPAGLVLGDPGARDSAIHAVQACIPHATILPLGIERLWLDVVPADEPRVVEAREIGRDGDTLTYDIDVRDATGRLRERWQGLRLKIVGDAVRPGAWPAALLAPYVERRVEDLLPGAAIAVALTAGGGDRRTDSDAAICLALGRLATVRRRPDGKPEVDGEFVSAAHSGRLTLGIAGRGPVGCDIERVVPREDSDWQALLGSERWSVARRLANTLGEDADTAATRVWSAIECAKKAGVTAGPCRIGSIATDGCVVLELGRQSAVTMVSRVRDVDGALVLAILGSPGTPPCAPTSTVISSASKKPTWSETSTT